jgi:hypothetical protein
MNDRAVSNVLGFILLFAVIFASLTATATLGMDALGSARDTAVTMNAEASMEGLAGSLDDINHNNVSARTATFRMGSGTLEPAEPVDVAVDIAGSTVVDATFRPIRYRFQDTELVYSLGGVFRTQESGERVVRAPSFVLENDAVILPLLVTEADDPNRGVGGSTSVVYAQRTGNDLEHVPDSGGPAVTMEIDTTERRAGLWEAAVDPCTDSGGGTVVCDPLTNTGTTVIVRQTDVTYEFNS